MTAEQSGPHGVFCGTDVVAIDRIADLVDRFGESFVGRIFTESEIAYCRSRPVPAQHFAARWAAKEAAIKALPPAETTVVPSNVEVVSEGDRPRLAFRDGSTDALEEYDRVNTAVSLSHDRTIDAATAQVVLLVHDRTAVGGR
jgi:holo-[acyl-carrier protein] synthase